MFEKHWKLEIIQLTIRGKCLNQLWLIYTMELPHHRAESVSTENVSKICD